MLFLIFRGKTATGETASDSASETDSGPADRGPADAGPADGGQLMRAYPERSAVSVVITRRVSIGFCLFFVHFALVQSAKTPDRQAAFHTGPDVR